MEAHARTVGRGDEDAFACDGGRSPAPQRHGNRACRVRSIEAPAYGTPRAVDFAAAGRRLEQIRRTSEALWTTRRTNALRDIVHPLRHVDSSACRRVAGGGRGPCPIPVWRRD